MDSTPPKTLFTRIVSIFFVPLLALFTISLVATPASASPNCDTVPSRIQAHNAQAARHNASPPNPNNAAAVAAYNAEADQGNARAVALNSEADGCRSQGYKVPEIVGPKSPRTPEGKRPEHVLPKGGSDTKTKMLEDLRKSNWQPNWSSKKGADSQKNAFSHWDKHGREFTPPGSPIIPPQLYAQLANRFVKNPPPGTLSWTRPGTGEKVFYNPSSNTFASTTSSGAIKTFFKPSGDSSGYWLEQLLNDPLKAITRGFQSIVAGIPEMLPIP